MRFYQAKKNLVVLYRMSDTEPIQTPKKTKTPRSEEQLQVLAEARKKAYAVRAENKTLRDQEKQMERDIKEQAKQERMAKVKAHQQTKKKPVKPEVLVEEEFESESEEEEIVVRKRSKAKPKAKKKKTRIVYETDSDEELEEEPPTPIRRSSVPTPLTPQQILRKKLYAQMF